MQWILSQNPNKNESANSLYVIFELAYKLVGISEI